ncbi:MAG TPA: VIT domain-containing protein [Thermoanaerobaculia bacterium]
MNVLSAATLPSLTVTDERGSSALTLAALRVDVLIRGHLARTTFELTYRNALDHDVDGQFVFPLPADAEVSELGLYFNGTLRHAVAVERVAARRAYEETIHRRVDPILGEWSASSREFRFRVYPIPARGTKVVHIAYDQELSAAPYTLDLDYGVALEQFDLNVDSDVRVEADGVQLRRNGALQTSSTRQQIVTGSLRATRDDDRSALVAWSSDDSTWYASAPLRLRTDAQRVAAPQHATLLYDVSASAAQRNEANVQAFLTGFAARAWRVVPFHVDVDAAIDSSTPALERTLADLDRGGATNLLALLEQLPAIAAAAPDSRLVLVSDGISTFGDSQRLARAIEAVVKIGKPLTIVNASPSADDHLLRRLAYVTRGWYLDLTRLSIEEAVSAAMRTPERAEVASALPAIRDVVLASATAIDTTVSGRSPNRINVFPVIAGNARHELRVRELASETERELVRRAWARARLRAMLDSGVPAEKVREHGRAFTQLTPHTSLLVLDSWSDYERFGFPLPRDLRAQRDAEIASIAARESVPGSIALHRPSSGSRTAGWSLSGVVLLADDAVPLPGVTVTVATREGNSTVVSDAQGRFNVSRATAPSPVSITAELAGFSTITREFRRIENGSSVDIYLPMPAVTEAITVTASAPSVVRSDSLEANEMHPMLHVDKAARVNAALALRADDPGRAVRALTDAAEAWPDDAPLLRIIGRVLAGWDRADLARLLFERALELSPGETQTWRELLLLTAQHGTAEEHAMLRRCYETAERDERSSQTDLTVRAELARARGGADARRVDSQQLQVEVMWDSGYTDVDLHVVEPDGEEVSFSHRASKNGGSLHDDVRSGFGPETYTIPRADGEYQIVLSYFDHDDPQLSRQTLAHVIVYLRGERRDYVVALSGAKEKVVVAKISR